MMPIQSNFAKFQLTFAAIFCAGALAFGLFGVVRPMMQMQAAKKWIETPCLITRSSVVRGMSRSSTRRRSHPTYSLSLAYEYQFEGQTFRETTYSFDATQLTGFNETSRFAAQWPVGAKTICWVNPTSPGEAVLKRDAQQPAVLMVVPVILLVAGIGVGLNAWKTLHPMV